MSGLSPEERAERCDRLFAIYERAARRNENPSSEQLAELIGVPSYRFLPGLYRQLQQDRRIDYAELRGRGTRRVTILVGPQAGKTVGGDLPTEHQPLHCKWCGKAMHKTYDGNTCSAKHHRLWVSSGYNSQEIVEQRATHVARQPKGCATVEEFLAAGGTIYREPRVVLGQVWQ